MPWNWNHRNGIFLEVLGTEHMRSLGFLDAAGPLENAPDSSNRLRPVRDGGFDIIAEQAVAQCKYRSTRETPIWDIRKFRNDCDGHRGIRVHRHKIRIFYATKMSFENAQAAEDIGMAVWLVDRHSGVIKPFNDSAFALGLAADVRRGDLSPAIADYWSWRMSEVSAASKFSPLESLSDVISMFLPKTRSKTPASDLSDAAKIAARCFYGEHEFLPAGPILDWVREVLETSEWVLEKQQLPPEMQPELLPTNQLVGRSSDGAAFRPGVRALQDNRPARSSLGSQLPMARCSVTGTPRSSLGAAVSPRCSAGAPRMPPLRAAGAMGKAARAGVAILQLAAHAAASAR